MPQKTILPVLRELAKAYQAFEAYSALHIRLFELTPPQFDIIATLGNTPGMALKELGEKTLITKGTLTGIVDRLAIKKLVRRINSPVDGRSQIVQLTKKGETLFTRIFPAHLAHIERAFTELSSNDLSNMKTVLHQLSEVFTTANRQFKDSP